MVGEAYVALDSLEINNLYQEADEAAAHIYNNWVLWYQARSVWQAVCTEVTQYLEATDTKGTTNVSSGFSHTTNRPKLAQIYDNLMANYKPGLMPTRDWMSWEGEDLDAVNITNRKLIEGFLKTKHRISGFSRVIDELLDDWIRCGNCFVGVEYENNFSLDTKRAKITRGYKGPKAFRIDPLDIVFNPTSTSFENAPKILRSTYGLADLERKAATIGEPHKQKYLKTLQKLKEDRTWAYSNGQGGPMTLKGPGTEELNKYYQYTYSGFGSYVQYLQSSMIEILEFYGDMYNSATGEYEPDRHVVIADRRYVVLNEPTPTWNGKPHIYHVGWRKRYNNLWAMGPLEGLLGMQYRINHLENLKADAFDQMVDADTVLIGDVEIDYTESGSKEYTVSEQGDVKRIPPDTTILSADMQIAELESAMDLFAGSPREAAGFRTPGEKTKFEVSQLMTAGGKIFQHKLERFEEYLLEPVLNAEIEVTRQAGEYQDTIELLDPETGVKLFETITADDLYMNGKFIPVGARHYSKQQQLAQDARDLMGIVIQDQEMLQHFPSAKMAQLFEELMGFDRYQLYQKFGRIYERADAQRIQSVAIKQLEDEEDAQVQEPESIRNVENSPDPFENLP